MLLIRPETVDLSAKDQVALEQAWLCMQRHGEREHAKGLSAFMADKYGYRLADLYSEYWPTRVLGFKQTPIRGSDIAGRNNAWGEVCITGESRDTVTLRLTATAARCLVEADMMQAPASSKLESIRAGLYGGLSDVEMLENNNQLVLQYWRTVSSDVELPYVIRKRSCGPDSFDVLLGEWRSTAGTDWLSNLKVMRACHLTGTSIE